MMCPRMCGIDRKTQTGFCHAGEMIKINLAMLHFGEEPPISGLSGSGTIFLSNCNLKCVFCQNYKISSLGWGKEYSTLQVVKLMLELQNKGAHNINFVTPSHFSEQLRECILIAKEQGLSIPIVWNSNAYENVEVLERLDKLVDIYLPDLKFAHGVYSKRYCNAADYVSISRAAVKFMYKQVGNLHVDAEGIAKSGMIIRLLVLPHKLANVENTLRWIAEELGTEIDLSIMGQYYPTHRALDFKELNRGIEQAEYDMILSHAHELGFTNVFAQELSCNSEWTPNFETA